MPVCYILAVRSPDNFVPAYPSPRHARSLPSLVSFLSFFPPLTSLPLLSCAGEAAAKAALEAAEGGLKAAEAALAAAPAPPASGKVAAEDGLNLNPGSLTVAQLQVGTEPVVLSRHGAMAGAGAQLRA